MKSKFYKNEKFQTWFFPILYFLLAVSIVVTGCLSFKKLYYQPIVVTGTSMFSTLAGGPSNSGIGTTIDVEDGGVHYSATMRYHYGIADLHRSSVNELKRFDVVVTYYPQSWGADGSKDEYLQKRSYKIKRVWGFPGETINLKYDHTTECYTFTAFKPGEAPYTITSKPKDTTYKQTYEYEYKVGNKTKYVQSELSGFTVNEFVLPDKSFRVSQRTPATTGLTTRNISNYKLANNEFFVMGDNFSGSTDCYEKSSVEKLTSGYVQGRVICITAFTTYDSVNKKTYNNRDIEKRYNF